MRCRLFLFQALLFWAVSGWTQGYDMEVRRGVSSIEIPFEYENNFIIVKVIFNDVFPLKFIFDTGAEHTILTRREITDILQINYERRFPIVGSDLSTELYAYLARGVNLTLNKMVALNRSILVLDEDYFRFEEFGGINVQGIIGADLFRRFIVKIDYRRRVITLYDPSKFELPSNRYEEIPIEISRNKPYMYAPTSLTSDTTIQGKYLIDTGASLALLLYTNTHPAFNLPPQYIRSKIGMGLGGYLQGFLGRIEQIDIGPFGMDGVVTNFQDVPPGADSSIYMNDRNGIIGNEILSRFEIIIDYINEKMYLKAGKNLRQKFQYDKSGLIIAASGAALNSFTVVDIIANSPAAQSDLRIGDEIKNLNGLPTNFMSLGDLTKKLRQRSGKRIRMIIRRGDERLKKEFRLRELL